MLWLTNPLNMRRRYKPRAPQSGDDFYTRLGVKPTATPSELRRAYRSRAKVFHPDVNPGDGASGEAFKLVAEAFTILSDAESRRRYDKAQWERGRTRSGGSQGKRAPARQFARGFLSGAMTILCLVPAIWLADVARTIRLPAVSTPSPPARHAETRIADAIKKNGEAFQLVAARELPIETITASSAPESEAASQEARRLQSEPPALVALRSDPEIIPTIEIGVESLKDSDAQISGDAVPTSADRSEAAKLVGADLNADERDPSRLSAGSVTSLAPSARDRLESAEPVIEEHVRAAVTRQIKALRGGDGQAAFAIASPAVQGKFRDPQKFLQMVTTSYPDIPASETASFLGLVRTRDQVIARFLLEGPRGRSVEARYYMVQLTGRWRIDGCVVFPR